jgi:hypothetical protein
MLCAAYVLTSLNLSGEEGEPMSTRFLIILGLAVALLIGVDQWRRSRPDETPASPTTPVALQPTPTESERTEFFRLRQVAAEAFTRHLDAESGQSEVNLARAQAGLRAQPRSEIAERFERDYQEARRRFADYESQWRAKYGEPPK